MILFGSTPMMGSTQRPQRTKLNFLAWLYPPWISWFGKYGHLQKVKFLLGWHYKIGFGPHNGWKSVVGQTVAFASYAKENKKRVHIFSSSATTRLGFGDQSFRSLVLLTWTPPIGTLRTPSMNGGIRELTIETPIDKPWPPSLCLCLGLFETNEMLGCSDTSVRRRPFSLTSS